MTTKKNNYVWEGHVQWPGPYQTPDHLTATEVDRLTNEHMNNLMEMMRPGMNKRHFQAFAEAVQQIEQGIIALHIPMPEHYREQIIELVTARIALVCAKDNSSFDSFKFAEAARKNALRGISGASAARHRSGRTPQRSKP